MSLSIRPADKKYLDALHKIERECFTFEAFTKDQLAFLLDDANSVGLVAFVNDEIAGFVIGVIYDWGREKIGHVVTLDVALKYRRKGVGMRLLKDLELKFKEKGVDSCYLEVREDNKAAQQLYRNLGYEQVRVLEDYYGPGVNGVQFKKLLV